MWNPLAKYMTVYHGLELANATAKRAASVDACMNKIIDRIEKLEADVGEIRADIAPHCSFCSKSGYDVRILIVGPKGVFICNECVRICTDKLLKEGAGS